MLNTSFLQKGVSIFSGEKEGLDIFLKAFVSYIPEICNVIEIEGSILSLNDIENKIEKDKKIF